MAGLFDAAIIHDPQRLAGLQLGLGLLGAASGTGRGIANAFGGAIQSAQQSQELERRRLAQELERRMQEQQYGMNERTMQRQDRVDAAAQAAALERERYVATLPPAVQQGVRAGVIDAQKLWERDNPQAKLETIYDPMGREQKAWVTAPGQAPTPVGGAKAGALPDGMRMGANGPEWIPGYLSGKSSIAKAGATNIGLKVENKMGESIAQQVGPMVKASFDQAQGAIKQADAADRILRALDSGKVMAGPGTSLRVAGLQLGQVLGVGGQSAAETLQNTRGVIRGLAEFSLNARGALAGQGQITENEQRLLDRAVSGDVDSLSVPEIRQITQITRRQAEKLHQQHRKVVGTVRSNPNLEALAPYYEVPDFPAQAGSVDDLVNRYRSK